MVSKPVVCINDEPTEDDKTAEIEEWGWLITKDSLRLVKKFGQPEATCSEGQLWTLGYSSQP